ncbi:GNAT family N-acetyltransferase [Pseudoalteromonas sp. T1lg23B]|uniref:GNAT family N-acetyltransferase n=1 Tax=Pseudoalteromonas sp. T1lg23B TaxID=2077097 RepID=UPI000CF72743|nr:GNAT family N-acetyltransferase [Pseudoalteromonas sp. T1lg23B]
MKTLHLQATELACITPVFTQLVEILGACINEGASLGFHKPAQADLLQQYWHDISDELRLKQRHFYAIFTGDTVLACVQLVPCDKQNGTHRAEIEKLLVRPSAQRQGLARKLVQFLEQQAVAKKLRLLILDTHTGDKSELFYQALNYQKSGQIPNFVTDASGQFNATSYYYKVLPEEPAIATCPQLNR